MSNRQKTQKNFQNKRYKFRNHRWKIRKIITLLFLLFGSFYIIYWLLPETSIPYIFPFKIEQFFVSLFSKVSSIISAAKLIVLLLFISLTSIVLLSLLVKLLPYHIMNYDDQILYKKLLVPYYRSIVLIGLSSKINKSEENVNSAYYQNSAISDFYNSFLSNYSNIGLLLTKTLDPSPAIFFVLAESGLALHKIKSNLEKKIKILTQFLEIYNVNLIPKISSVDEIRSQFPFILKRYYQRTPLISKNSNINNIVLSFYSVFKNVPYGSSALFNVSDGKLDGNFSVSIYTSHPSKQDAELFYSYTPYKPKKTSLLNRKLLLFGLFRISNKKRTILIDSRSFVKILQFPSKFVFPSNYQEDSEVVNKHGQKQQITIGYKLPAFKNKTSIKNPRVNINLNDILLNVEICGMIGHGKTQLVLSIIKQLLSFKVGILIFDIKGEYAKALVEHPDVEIYTIGPPNPLCLNIFETRDDTDVRSTLLVIEEMFMSSKLELSPSMKNLFEYALFKTHNSDNRNIKTFITNLFSITEELRRRNNTPYMQQTLDALLNRLNFIFNPLNFEILGVSKTTLDFDLLNKGKTVILDLSQLQKRAARPSDIFLICNMVLKYLYRYALSHGHSRGLKYVVVMEEAINIIPNFYHVESSASLITAENNFLLGRTLGIGHITVTQLWRSVSNIVHGNSSTKIIFRTSENIDEVSQALNLTEEEKDKLKTLPQQQCFLFSENMGKAVLIQTLDQTVRYTSQSKYISILLSRYRNKPFPLLYKNFIEMRDYISNHYFSSHNAMATDSKNKKSSQKTLSPSVDKYFSPNVDDPIDSITKPSEHEPEVNTINEIEDICNYCPLVSSRNACIRIQLLACTVHPEIARKNSSSELFDILDKPEKLNTFVKKIVSLKLNNDEHCSLMLCVARCIISNVIENIDPKNQDKITHIINKYLIYNSNFILTLNSKS